MRVPCTPEDIVPPTCLPYRIPSQRSMWAYHPSFLGTTVARCHGGAEGCGRRTTPQDVRKVERRQRRALVRCVVTRHAAACGVGGAMMPPTSLDIVVYGHDGCCDACPRRAMPRIWESAMMICRQCRTVPGLCGHTTVDRRQRRAVPQSVGMMNAGAVFMTCGAAGWADTRRERVTHASRGGAICCVARRR